MDVGKVFGYIKRHPYLTGTLAIVISYSFYRFAKSKVFSDFFRKNRTEFSNSTEKKNQLEQNESKIKQTNERNENKVVVKEISLQREGEKAPIFEAAAVYGGEIVTLNSSMMYPCPRFFS
eukprot:TRINITY_DN4059_c0_g1_i4.p2 TRINITY_DN4059_c0_g1~~TRINITY_DN4059_c0_g1_i4.p2  ORF type:complete len:120 (+),score=17.89 TRINITY_DN4059_c0_g1_i4:50-409(+)